MKTDPCRTCGAPMIWTVTRKRKKMPLDAAPIPSGAYLLEIMPDGSLLAAWVGVSSPHPGPRYSSHFQTCPQAREHKDRPRVEAAAEGTCRPAPDGYCAVHPTCELVRTLLDTLRARVQP